MSWRPEVQTTGGHGNWNSNALIFATETEAKDYVRDLMWRWMQVTDTRVVETSDPVSHRWAGNKLEPVEP